ncbi:MAG: monovalent cation/H+ antiporter complex subunit F [Chloroflexota bacterium]
MISTILNITIQAAFAIHALLIGYAIYRVWRGKDTIGRLLGVELVGTLTIAVLVLLALVQQNRLFIDVALGLGALGFISVIGFAKYTADQPQIAEHQFAEHQLIEQGGD